MIHMILVVCSMYYLSSLVFFGRIIFGGKKEEHETCVKYIVGEFHPTTLRIWNSRSVGRSVFLDQLKAMHHHATHHQREFFFSRNNIARVIGHAHTFFSFLAGSEKSTQQPTKNKGIFTKNAFRCLPHATTYTCMCV